MNKPDNIEAKDPDVSNSGTAYYIALMTGDAPSTLPLPYPIAIPKVAAVGTTLTLTAAPTAAAPNGHCTWAITSGDGSIARFVTPSDPTGGTSGTGTTGDGATGDGASGIGWSYTLDGATASDSVRVTVLDAAVQMDCNNDGSIDASDDACKQTAPGALVGLHQPNDPDPSSNLQPMVVKILPADLATNLPQGTFTISASGPIRVWSQQSTSSTLILAGGSTRSWDFSNDADRAQFPGGARTFFVEGASAGIFNLSCYLGAPGAAASDSLTGTVVFTSIYDPSAPLATSATLLNWNNDYDEADMVDGFLEYDYLDLKSLKDSDDDLKPTRFSYGPADLRSCQLVLTAPPNVRYWSDDKKTTLVAEAGGSRSWNLNSDADRAWFPGGEATLYLEGVTTGTGTTLFSLQAATSGTAPLPSPSRSRPSSSGPSLASAKNPPPITTAQKMVTSEERAEFKVLGSHYYGPVSNCDDPTQNIFFSTAGNSANKSTYYVAGMPYGGAAWTIVEVKSKRTMRVRLRSQVIMASGWN